MSLTGETAPVSGSWDAGYWAADGGSLAQTGPAILGSDGVVLTGAGQLLAPRFVEAGTAAALTAQEVAGIGWRHKMVHADVEIEGRPMRLSSLHARPGTGGGRGTAYVGWIKQLFDRVCAAWLSENEGTAVVGVDANSPKVDRPDPALWEPFVAGGDPDRTGARAPSR